MNLSDRMDRVENMLETHLTESGEIRQDIKWLKKAYWSLVGLGGIVTGAVCTAGFEHIWK